MELPHKALDELKELFRQHEGVELSDAEASEIAENILTVFALVYKPIPKKLLAQRKDQFPDLVRLLEPETSN